MVRNGIYALEKARNMRIYVYALKMTSICLKYAYKFTQKTVFYAQQYLSVENNRIEPNLNLFVLNVGLLNNK